MQSALIAYSGGVDSSFLLRVASDVLGNQVVAVTARSETYPTTELEEAKTISDVNSMRHSCRRCGREFFGDKDRVFCSRDCARLFGYEASRFKRIRKNGTQKEIPQDRRIVKKCGASTMIINP